MPNRRTSTNPHPSPIWRIKADVVRMQVAELRDPRLTNDDRDLWRRRIAATLGEIPEGERDAELVGLVNEL